MKIVSLQTHKHRNDELLTLRVNKADPEKMISLSDINVSDRIHKNFQLQCFIDFKYT